MICASNGVEAEIKVSRNLPDLVLLDVDIPFKDGFQVCTELKHNPQTRLIPVVLLTGLDQATDRMRGIEAGADDFLTKPIDPFELQARVRSLLKRKEYTDELETAEHVLMALGASIEAKDSYTEGHCDRISRFSQIFGKELNLSDEELRALRIAGSVHDIGKVAVPDSILLKRGPLNAEEREIMQRHTIVGENICRQLRSFQTVLPIIRHHHERQDGSGYPDGISSTSVPLLARIMQLVDVYDALTTDRPYRQALPHTQALREISAEVKRGWWDKELFAIFSVLALQGRFHDNFSLPRIHANSQVAAIPTFDVKAG